MHFCFFQSLNYFYGLENRLVKAFSYNLEKSCLASYASLRKLFVFGLRLANLFFLPGRPVEIWRRPVELRQFLGPPLVANVCYGVLFFYPEYLHWFQGSKIVCLKNRCFQNLGNLFVKQKTFIERLIESFSISTYDLLTIFEWKNKQPINIRKC